jgi:hypothetical protein
VTEDDLILHLFCLVDDELRAAGLTDLRSRGPGPGLTDAEALAIELAGAALGLAHDADLFRYFRRHHARAFPRLASMHRTTFIRQAAHLGRVKQALHARLADRLCPGPAAWLVDSLPIPACRFGRAPYCRRYYGQADFGYDYGARHVFYGFRLHLRASWDGIILAARLAPARASEPAVAPELNPPPGSVGVGDRGYWDPALFDLLAEIGVRFHAPYRSKRADPDPAKARRLARVRYRIETTQGQLTERFGAKRLKTQDVWHLEGRLWRAILCHTALCHLCRQAGLPTLSHAKLLAA